MGVVSVPGAKKPCSIFRVSKKRLWKAMSSGCMVMHRKQHSLSRAWQLEIESTAYALILIYVQQILLSNHFDNKVVSAMETFKR